jgi:hypothetical protein
MVQHILIFILIFCFSGPGSAQDERYYRQIFTGELPKSDTSPEINQQFFVKGAIYHLDLDDDKIEEMIEPSKIDGVDWIEIKSSGGSTHFKTKLPAIGGVSTLYKIKLVRITSSAKALILFLDEGVTSGLFFESTARIYVLTYEKNNLKEMALTLGPHFFHEKERQREQYMRRDYSVNVYDIDGDGIREISVQYNHIQRIMKYMGNGEWSRF